MAKDKKRGFFSWLGFGKEETPQQPAETQETEQLAPEHVETPAEVQAEEIVAITEKVAEAEKVQSEPVAKEAPPRDNETVNAEAFSVQTGAPDDEIAAPPTAAPISEEELTALAIGELEIEPDAPLSDDELAALALADEHPEAIAVEAEPAAAHPEAIVAEVEPVDAHPDVIATNVEPVAAHSDAIVEEIEPADDVEAAVLPVEQDRPTKEGFFARLKRSLVKTRQNLGSGFISLFRGKKIDDELFEELEEQLLIADVGVETTRRIITNLTQQANRKQLRDAEALYGLLKTEMAGILATVEAPLNVAGKAPFVILMVGVNGVGKTTTIGKLARQYQAEGKSVMLAAGDTFRAAAVEQLQVWGQRNNISVVAQHTGADSASVIFDAIQAAKARGVDVLIADTAGRLQNKAHLMEELKKITRVMKKLDVDAPHEVMLTIDASTGQNAISQTKLFHEAVGLTGITLTKLDGTAKGGVIFSVADQFNIPIRYIGVGEGIEDLRPFKAEDFIEALFARED
ncbi:signal recognition particle-docking protein FtsY [Duffyella gerundensis]|uniref:signal recognition particle-docking protein FtsY n=1 Tax=Duffyella TaxID=3026546 RepID=UPI003F6DE2F5